MTQHRLNNHCISEKLHVISKTVRPSDFRANPKKNGRCLDQIFHDHYFEFRHRVQELVEQIPVLFKYI